VKRFTEYLLDDCGGLWFFWVFLWVLAVRLFGLFWEVSVGLV